MRWMILLMVAVGCAPAVALHPEAAQHNQRGAELLQAGELEDAEASFELALEYNENFAEAWSNLGIVALERGELDLADERLSKAVKLNSQLAQAWSNLGLVHERRGRTDKAIDAYRRAIGIQPGLFDARVNLALALIKQDDIVAAREQLLRAVQLQPEDDVAQGMLGYCDLRLGDFDKAADRAEAVLSVNPDSPVSRVVRGILLAHRQDYDAAEVDLRYGLDDPVLGRAAATRLAAIQAARGARGEAWKQVQALLDEDPNDGAVQLLAAWLRLDQGDWRSAKQHAERALELSPELDEAREILRKACKKGGGTCTSSR